ncbi:hypothetical protein OBP_176 [Pseudomonas phage OBP]|nr:hypothetical protein OBP_176 [Pseudomonas phage OBP]AEV89613.1 hypothetical protein OBP_176 [Pseudomonas phage OBP]
MKYALEYISKKRATQRWYQSPEFSVFLIILIATVISLAVTYFVYRGQP